MTQKQCSLLSAEDVAMLESFEGQYASYFGKMKAYLDEFVQAGLEAGRFTQEEADADLELALWYGYACNNLDTYEAYYTAVQRMAGAEKNAAGCGTWYYRYAAALMYCGKLELALEYAEKGAKEEPTYPWIWLPVAKLRSHFGDIDGALAAVAKGLELELGDYEFTTLKQEIEQGCSLEQMEYHYIHEENDRELQAGEGDIMEICNKQQSIAGMVCNRENLAEIQQLLQASQWEADTPYCSFRFPLLGRSIEGVFFMNEAAVSKLKPDWVAEMLELVRNEDEGLRIRLAADGYGNTELSTMSFHWDESIQLLYYNPETDEQVSMSWSRKRAEEQAADMEADSGQYPSMFTLYLQDDDGLHYAECWLSQEGEEYEEEYKVHLHKGDVGDLGMHQKLDCASLEDYQQIAAEFYQDFASLGYEPWPEEAMQWVVVQFPVHAMDMGDFNPTQEDLELRDAAYHILNETLGWYGLGHVDGWEMGRSVDSADGRETYVLNLYGCVVDAEGSVGIIIQALEKQLDCSRMKIATRQASEEAYGLVYAADCSNTFSL